MATCESCKFCHPMVVYRRVKPGSFHPHYEPHGAMGCHQGPNVKELKDKGDRSECKDYEAVL